MTGRREKIPKAKGMGEVSRRGNHSNLGKLARKNHIKNVHRLFPKLGGMAKRLKRTSAIKAAFVISAKVVASNSPGKLFHLISQKAQNLLCGNIEAISQISGSR